jgi:predicted phage terminase large subunit-like protein
MELTPKQMGFIAATVLDNPYIPHVPTPRQIEFLVDEHDECMYGGACGGGKSNCLLMAALQFVDVPGYSALILRRTYSDLALPGAVMDRAKSWLINKPGVKWIDKEKKFVFPSGSTLTFGYLENDSDKYRYQSSEYQFIGIDEITQFPSEDTYTYMFSRLRRLAGSDVPLRMRSATNPGGPGHQWVKARFIDSTDLSRNFIPAKLDENPYLDRDSYECSLAKLDLVTREQLRNGNWEISATGGIFTMPNLHFYEVQRYDWREDPHLANQPRFAAVDLSEGAHDHAVIVTGFRLKDDRVLIWDYRAKTENQSDTIDAILDANSRYSYQLIVIEGNSTGHSKNAVGMGLFEQAIRKRASDRGQTLPFKLIWNTKNKDDRILSLEPYVTNGSVLVRNDWERAYPELINELIGWRPEQKNAYDDGVDAVEMLTFSVFDNIRIASRQTVPIAPICLDRPSPWVAPREQNIWDIVGW